MASDVSISTFSKNDKNCNFTEKYAMKVFVSRKSVNWCTAYIQKINNFRLVVCSLTYCLDNNKNLDNVWCMKVL